LSWLGFGSSKFLIDSRWICGELDCRIAHRNLNVLPYCRWLNADCCLLQSGLFPLQAGDVGFGSQMNAGEREYYRRKGRNDF
jgi:hypothetical protein